VADDTTAGGSEVVAAGLAELLVDAEGTALTSTAEPSRNATPDEADPLTEAPGPAGIDEAETAGAAEMAWLEAA
jgi:hypothetical protein